MGINEFRKQASLISASNEKAEIVQYLKDAPVSFFNNLLSKIEEGKRHGKYTALYFGHSSQYNLHFKNVLVSNIQHGWHYEGVHIELYSTNRKDLFKELLKAAYK